MNTFTEEIKNEIVNTPIESDCCRAAFLSAFIRASGSIVSSGGTYGFEIVTENEKTAEFVCDLVENYFGLAISVHDAEYDNKRGKDKLTLRCLDENSGKLLKKLGIIKQYEDGVSLSFNIDGRLVKKDCCKAAYLRGAFLGGGSCTLPDEQTYSRTGYHYEIVFSNKITAGDLSELLCFFEILSKLVSRKDSAVVYIKSKEVISDLLALMGCYKSLDKLNKIVEYKDRSNNENRVSNCSVSNIDKAVTASVAQVRAIGIIADTVGLQSLDKNLFDVAEARLADVNASMSELAARLSITKSCINHRMRKIFDIAAHLG